MGVRSVHEIETYVSPDFRLGFFQPQTCRRKAAILTSCCITLTIHGCDSIRLGFGRALGSRVRLRRVSENSLSTRYEQYARHFEEILHFRTIGCIVVVF